MNVMSYMLFLLGFCTINQLLCYSCRKNKELFILLRMYFAIRINFVFQQDIPLWVRIKVWLKIFPFPYRDCDIYPSSVSWCGQYYCRLLWPLVPLFFFVIILPDPVLVALVAFINQLVWPSSKFWFRIKAVDSHKGSQDVRRNLPGIENQYFAPSWWAGWLQVLLLPWDSLTLTNSSKNVAQEQLKKWRGTD